MSPAKLKAVPSPSPLTQSIARAQNLLLSHQQPEGYWWYTLEANETIGSGYIQLTHFLGCVDSDIEAALLTHMLDQQRNDGSWGLYYGAPGDLSATVEAYLALRLGGHSPDEKPLRRARAFILDNGGLTGIRIFTRIHLALLGLVSWRICPEMPAWLIFMPALSGFSIYEFSSWARASIVPLMVILDKKPVRPVSFDLSELSTHPPVEKDWEFTSDKGLISWDQLFISADTGLKWLRKLPWHPGKKQTHASCEKWIRDHLERTEDIYPALAYGALALATLGYPLEDPHIQKALRALRQFQQPYEGSFPAVVTETDRHVARSIHQQCCISPIWDTPWAATALLTSGQDPASPPLKEAGHYLLSKQIHDFKGDWAIKNPRGVPGGWAFEFQNDYFPDIDDTLQILSVLKQVAIPESEKKEAIERGLGWLLSMQSKNGGWAAFDKDNLATWVNLIPFSDHGACLDPPTPDITGRMIELLTTFGYKAEDKIIRRALTFIGQEQRVGNHLSLPTGGSKGPTYDFGAWEGRWGVHFLYGTWCVLQGLAAIGFGRRDPMVGRAVRWLEAAQCDDGGWGESCAGYKDDCFVPLDHGVPSQTAWALLALMAVGKIESEPVQDGIDFLTRTQRPDGGWDEPEFTGTGFPGHFFIRYHGYRHYFPLLALGTYTAKKR